MRHGTRAEPGQHVVEVSLEEAGLVLMSSPVTTSHACSTLCRDQHLFWETHAEAFTYHMATRTVMKRSFDDACSPRHYEAYVELNAEKKCRSVTSIVTIADALASEGPGSESDDGRRSPATPAAVAASGAKFERLFNGGGARTPYQRKVNGE